MYIHSFEKILQLYQIFINFRFQVSLIAIQAANIVENSNKNKKKIKKIDILA